MVWAAFRRCMRRGHKPHRVIVHREQARLLQGNAITVGAGLARDAASSHTALSFIASKLGSYRGMRSLWEPGLPAMQPVATPRHRSSRASSAPTGECDHCGSEAWSGRHSDDAGDAVYQNATEVCTYTVRGSPTYLPRLLSSNERVKYSWLKMFFTPTAMFKSDSCGPKS